MLVHMAPPSQKILKYIVPQIKMEDVQVYFKYTVDCIHHF